MRRVAFSLAVVVTALAACPGTPDRGEGEGEVGEGEGEGEGEDVPLDGFGVIGGPCGQLDDELTSASPAFIEGVAIDFGTDPYDDPADRDLLTAGARQIITDGNAGGSSIVSEAITFDLLARCEGASLIETETNIEYTVSPTKITDFIVEIDGVKVGVNPVRTFVFGGGALTQDEARRRLEGKLDDALVSSANVAPEFAWEKQIIVVVAPEAAHIPVVKSVWEGLDAATRADTIVYAFHTDGADGPLY